MLLFLQQNAEWMCAVAIVIFTAAQCLISYAQYKQELRLRRFNLAHQMDEAYIICKNDVVLYKINNEELKIKRFKNMGNYAILWSDNFRNYNPIEINEEYDYYLGRMISIISA